MSERALHPTSPDRRPVSGRALALAIGVIAALLALVAWVAYRELIYYERRAIEHVPPGAELALRIDLEQVVLFDPLRRHLLPLLDRAPIGDAAAAPGRLLRLREAGVNLGMDLRELVYARQPGGAWVLALGGIFGGAPLLPRVEAVLRAEPGARLRSEGALLILERSGAALGQSEDGVLLIASDAACLSLALPSTRAYEATGVSREAAAALGALDTWLSTLGARGTSSSSSARARVRLELGDPLQLEAEIDHDAPVDVEAVRRELDVWLGTPTDTGNFAPQADWGGERAVLARAILKQPSPTRIEVAASWERADFARAARSLAAWLESRLHTGGPVAR